MTAHDVAIARSCAVIDRAYSQRTCYLRMADGSDPHAPMVCWSNLLMDTGDSLSSDANSMRESAAAGQAAPLISEILSTFAKTEAPLRECVQECVDRLRVSLTAASVQVWTFDDREGDLDVVASSGLADFADKAARIALGASEIRIIAQDRAPHVANDISRDPQISRRHWAEREGAGAFAGYPLLAGDRLVGVIAFFSTGNFATAELPSLETAAAVLALAIDRKRSEESLRRSKETRRILASASAMLAQSLDYEATLANVAKLTIPELGDWCTVEIIEEDGTLRRIALAHSDPQLIARAQRLREKYPIDMTRSRAAGQIIRSGAPLMAPNISDEMLASARISPEELEFIRTLKLRSYVGAPLRARGRAFGVVSFLSSHRSHDAEDVAVAEELASLIAAAIDNSRLYQLSTSGEKYMRLLAELSLVLANSLNYDQTLQMIARVLASSLCDYAILYRVEGKSVARVAFAHRDSHDQELLQQMVAQPVAPAMEQDVVSVVETGQPQVSFEIDLSTMSPDRGTPEYLALVQKLKPTSYIMAPLKARGRALGALTVAMTTSGRKFQRADVPVVEEVARRAALALDNANLYEAAVQSGRLKDEFLAILSHELRTPLTSVHGWLTLLRGGNLNEVKKTQAFESIDRNVRAQITLIDELLDLSKISTGKMQLQMTEVHPVEAIEAAISLIHPSAAAKKIEVRLRHDVEGAVIRTDPVRFQQMLWNLLSNAVKFTRPGGKITLDATVEYQTLVISVSDDGVGIDQSVLPFIFDRFRQADSSTARHYGGLGIGLSVVKYLAEMHGGGIEAESRGRDQGATFRLRLPAYHQTSVSA